MKLGQAELFRVFNHHQRGVGHVHAHFHHRGGQQDLGLVGAEGRHDFFLFLALEPAVQKAHAPGGEDFFQMCHSLVAALTPAAGIGVLHAGINDVGLAALGEFFPQEGPDFGQAFRRRAKKS